MSEYLIFLLPLCGVGLHIWLISMLRDRYENIGSDWIVYLMMFYPAAVAGPFWIIVCLSEVRDRQMCNPTHGAERKGEKP